MVASSPHREDVQVHTAPPEVDRWFLCAILRRVGGGAPETALHSRVHANSYACINVVAQGEVQCAAGALPRTFVTGPFSAPFETAVPAPLASLSIVMQPWLLEPLLGLRADRLADGLVDAACVESAVLHEVCAVARGVCEGSRPIAELWAVARSWVEGSAAAEPPLFLDVLRSHGVDAAARAAACSSRHYRRRFLRHMGLAPATWLRISRWEQAVHRLAGRGDAASTLAELSAEAGYADQSHLTRETRAFVRETPAQLRRALGAGEGHWSLRPADVRIVQDAGAGGT